MKANSVTFRYVLSFIVCENNEPQGVDECSVVLGISDI